MDQLMNALPLTCRGGSACDSRTMATLLADCLQPGDVVLVKGSRRMGLESVVEAFAGRGG